MNLRLAFLLTCLVSSAWAISDQTSATVAITLTDNPADSQLVASKSNKKLFVYNYASDLHLPYFHPLNTPSGKNLLVDKTLPYPHHRALWVSDTVIRDGVKGDIYNSYYSGVKRGKNEYTSPFNTAARHVDFRMTTSTTGVAGFEETLVWETGRTTTTFPLLDETRTVSVHSLPQGYLLDFKLELKAAYGEVQFVSDEVHYAWPFLRLNSRFSGQSGGLLTSDTGTTGQANTNLKPALWMDFSNAVDGTSEGVALLQWPDGESRKWLTRDYGTFGPRRPDSRSGRPFTLGSGESLFQRVGIYMHSGDAAQGKVAEVYAKYVNGGFHE